MKRQALLSVGLLVTGIAASMVGCGDDGSSGDTDNAAGDAGDGGKNAGAGTTNNGGKGGTESNGGTSNGGNSTAGKGGAGGSGGVPVPMGGEGGVTQGGAGGTPDGGTPGDAGAGGAVGGAGGAGGAGGEGGSGPSCVLNSSYGNLGALGGEAEILGFGQRWRGVIAAPPPYEAELFVDLYPGYPPFENGLTTVSNYVLTGDNLNLETCGLCVRLISWPFINGEYGVPEQYFVTGGTISLSEVDDGITGSATNLSFEHVTVEDGHSTPVGDACESSVSAVSFNDDFPQGGAGGNGG